MKHSVKIAPAAALLSAVLSIACCLPLGIPAGVGLAGLGMLMGRLQPWPMASLTRVPDGWAGAAVPAAGLSKT